MMSFIASGDCFITRPLHDKKSQSHIRMVQLLKRAEARFANFEMTIAGPSAFPSAISGGTWAKAGPEVLQVIYDYGFNLLNLANNHTLDYSYQGLIDTQERIEELGFTYAGVGRNLAEASKPKFLECPSGRIALIAAVSSCPTSWVAGEQRPDIIGRPGVNPLRFLTTHTLPKEEMNILKTIADKTYINAENDLAILEGFSTKPEDGNFVFGDHRFKTGKKAGIHTEPLKKDMHRIIKSIEEAKNRADYVLISIHSHEMDKDKKNQPGEFLKIFARECIDAGADAVLGHGPHILRGIEIYKNRPIFYSLGNFIFQSDTIDSLPSDFYEKYGLGHDDNVTAALNKRSENNTKGLGVNRDVWRSIVPYWEMDEKGMTSLELHPINLGYDLPRYKRGWPSLTDDTEIIEILNELSLPFGTNIKIEGGIGVVRI